MTTGTMRVTAVRRPQVKTSYKDSTGLRRALQLGTRVLFSRWWRVRSADKLAGPGDDCTPTRLTAPRQHATEAVTNGTQNRPASKNKIIQSSLWTFARGQWPRFLGVFFKKVTNSEEDQNPRIAAAEKATANPSCHESGWQRDVAPLRLLKERKEPLAMRLSTRVQLE